MTYDEFINTLHSHQTAQIKPLSFPSCCAPSPIPSEFVTLLPEIVQILNSNIQKLCGRDEVFAVIGMQLGPPMLSSIWPKLLNRIIHKNQPNHHFCCVLQYLIVKQDTLSTVDSWDGVQTMVVDFTTGTLMDADRYFNIALGEKAKGVTYGRICRKQLSNAWQALRDNQHQYPLENHPSFNGSALSLSC
jgi:hypothetical protein